MNPTRREFLKTSTTAGLAGVMAGGMAAAAASQPVAQQQDRKAAIRIAVVQQACNPGRVEENRKKALRFAEQALANAADIILFHEELLIGYDKHIRELAEPLSGPTTRAFQALLKGTKSLILYGLAERDGDRCYIAAPLVGAGGVVANYRKTHLWWKSDDLRYEPGFYTPGDRLVTFDVRGHRSGVMICYDGDFPEMTRSYANLDCRMLFWMNHRSSRGYQEVHRLAETNSMIMATSCCCGVDERGGKCPGGSNITDAHGRLLAEIWNREGVIQADVQPEETVRLRSENPWYRGQRDDLYYYPDKAQQRGKRRPS
jgi:(R)-amidase